MHRPLKHLKANGFTIIELLIVIVVIGILAAITIVTYSGVQARAIDKSAQSDADGLEGLETRYATANTSGGKAWYSKNGSDSDLAFTPSKGNVIDVVTSTTDYCIRVYNPGAATYKTLATAYQKGSSNAACTSLSPSAAAIADSPIPGNLVLTARTGAGSHEWTVGVASSSDGTKLVAANGDSGLYTSTDSGVTWTQRFPEDYNESWSSMASSSDGTKLIAVEYGSTYHTSTDSGVTWTQRTNPSVQNWWSVASSSDGTKLVAGTDGYIYTSTDSGVTWTQRTGAGAVNGWWSVASSSDGTKLVAGTGGFTGGYIYTSTDSGATWTQRPSAGSRKWRAIASSADGTKLVAVAFGGYIYTSTDSGATWTERTGAGSHNWVPVASSADGMKIVAGDDGNTNTYLYTSSDGGVTWVQHTDVSKYWYSIAMSGDGTKIFASVESGYLYTGIYTP